MRWLANMPIKRKLTLIILLLILFWIFRRMSGRSCKPRTMQDPAIKAAHDKLRQAHKEFRDAMRTAMLKADPTIQPILDKMPKGNRNED